MFKPSSSCSNDWRFTTTPLWRPMIIVEVKTETSYDIQLYQNKWQTAPNSSHYNYQPPTTLMLLSLHIHHTYSYTAFTTHTRIQPSPHILVHSLHHTYSCTAFTMNLPYHIRNLSTTPLFLPSPPCCPPPFVCALISGRTCLRWHQIRETAPEVETLGQGKHEASATHEAKENKRGKWKHTRPGETQEARGNTRGYGKYTRP